MELMSLELRAQALTMLRHMPPLQFAHSLPSANPETTWLHLPNDWVGTWCTAGIEDHDAPGRLVWTKQQKLELELMGGPSGGQRNTANQRDVALTTPPLMNVIYGRSGTVDLTLLEEKPPTCAAYESIAQVRQVAQQTIDGECVFIGAHLPNPFGSIIKSAKVGLQHLDTWLAPTCAMPTTARVPTSRLKVNVDSMLTRTKIPQIGGNAEVEFESPFVSMTWENHQTLESVLTEVRHVTSFLEFVSGHECSVLWMTLNLEGPDGLVDCSVLSRFGGFVTGNPEDLTSRKCLVDSSEVDVQKVFAEWWKLRTVAAGALNLQLANSSGSRIGLEQYLAATTTAAEAVYKYTEGDAAKKLKCKLKTLASKLPRSADEGIDVSGDQLIGDFVKLRNSLVHEGISTGDGGAMFQSVSYVHAVLACAILHQLGLDDEKRHTFLRRSGLLDFT